MFLEFYGLGLHNRPFESFIGQIIEKSPYTDKEEDQKSKKI